MSEFKHERQKGTHQPPKHKPGARLGELTVIKALKYEARGQTKPRWWYQVECSCGEIEEMNQGQLHSRVDCKGCAADRKSRTLSRSKNSLAFKRPASDVPDFATMRLTS